MKGGDNLGKLRIEEVAAILHCSTNTINSWYRFRKQFPEDEYAKLLPDYTQGDSRTSARYWDSGDLWKFAEFRLKLPIGRNGVMGDITQKYTTRKGGKNNEQCTK